MPREVSAERTLAFILGSCTRRCICGVVKVSPSSIMNRRRRCLLLKIMKQIA